MPPSFFDFTTFAPGAVAGQFGWVAGAIAPLITNNSDGLVGNASFPTDAQTTTFVSPSGDFELLSYIKITSAGSGVDNSLTTTLWGDLVIFLADTGSTINGVSVPDPPQDALTAVQLDCEGGVITLQYAGVDQGVSIPYTPSSPTNGIHVRMGDTARVTSPILILSQF